MPGARGPCLENLALGVDVRQRELDLAINAAGTDQRRVKAFDPVGRHDHLFMRRRRRRAGDGWLKHDNALMFCDKQQTMPQKKKKKKKKKHRERPTRTLETESRTPYLDLATLLEPVQLGQQLDHGALDLALAAAGRVVPLRADRINLVAKHNAGRVLVGLPSVNSHNGGGKG